MSIVTLPSGAVEAISPIHTVELAKLSRAAACSAAGAPLARKRALSNWIATLLPMRRKTSSWVGPKLARSSPIGAEPSPVRKVVA